MQSPPSATCLRTHSNSPSRTSERARSQVHAGALVGGREQHWGGCILGETENRLGHVCAQPGSPTRCCALPPSSSAKSEPEPRLKAVVTAHHLLEHCASSKNRTAASLGVRACDRAQGPRSTVSCSVHQTTAHRRPSLVAQQSTAQSVSVRLHGPDSLRPEPATPTDSALRFLALAKGRTPRINLLTHSRRGNRRRRCHSCCPSSRRGGWASTRDRGPGRVRVRIVPTLRLARKSRGRIRRRGRWGVDGEMED